MDFNDVFTLWASLKKEQKLHLLAIFSVITLAIWLVQALAKQSARWVKIAIGTKSIPMAPEGHWLLGHVVPLATSCAWEKMYNWVRSNPPIVKFRIAHRTGIVVGDAHALKRIFQTRFKVYEKDLDFSYHPFLPILGSGLVTANGSHWQKQRLLMAPALRIDMLDAIIPIAKRAVDRLSTKLESFRGTSIPVDMEEEFRLLTLQVIGEAILSLPPEECDNVFPELYLPVMEESNKRVLAPWRYLYPIHVLRYNQRMHALNSFIIKLIRNRWNARISGQIITSDILDRILASVQEREEPWGPGVENQLCYEIKTFLLAGHETSAAMLTWSLYELSTAPESLRKIRKEADVAFSGLRKETDIPKREKIDDMEYTLCSLKESLRKYSVVPVVTRNLASPDVLCGHKIPAGSWIICHLQAVHHSYEDPLHWKPERFMPGGEYEQFDEDIRPYMFVPFIQGPRNCLGQYFALLEARVILALLCQKFTFSPVDPEKQGLTHPTVIPVGPVHGMKMIIT